MAATAIDLTAVTDTSFRPSLNDVHKVLKEEVVGEHESAMSLFTNWILSERNIMMAGQRSSGKTYITEHVMSFVGDIEKDEKGQGFILTSGSEKSGYYQADILNKAKYVVVLELNKIPKEMQEMLKDWGEGKDSKYKTVVTVAGTRRVQEMNVHRKPFVFCLADEDETTVDSQLYSRLTTIRTDNSITQNKNVMKFQADIARLPNNPLKVDDESKRKLKEHIMTLPPLGKYEWKNPAANMFIESIPPFFSDSRRDFQKYLINIAGICRFHWKDRMTTKIGSKEVFFITPADMYLNHIIYGKTIISSALKCNNIEREVMTILQASRLSLSRVDIQKELKKKGTTLSSGMTGRHLKSLVDLGYLEVAQSETDKKRYEYSIGKMFDEFSFTVDWKAIIDFTKKQMLELYPEVADEYIKRFCIEPLVSNPFSGEVVNLLQLKDEKVELVIGQKTLYDEPEEQPEEKVKIVKFTPKSVKKKYQEFDEEDIDKVLDTIPEEFIGD